MYCFSNNILPSVFDSYCKKPVHSFNTRFSKHNFSLPIHNSVLKDRSIKVIGPKVWTDVPLEIKVLPFRKSFTKKLKKTLLSSLPTEQSNRKKFDLDRSNKKEDIKSADFPELHDIFFNGNGSVDEEFFGFDSPD